MKSFLLFLLLSTGHAYAQKPMAVDDSLAAHASYYEPRIQKGAGTHNLTAYSFGDHRVAGLHNGWEKNGYWAVSLQEKKISRESYYRRSHFSFQFFNTGGDTASVVVLFQKAGPEGFFLHHGNESSVFNHPSFTALIRLNHDSLHWQLRVQLDDNAGWKSATRGQLTNGKTIWELEPVERRSDGTKPAITGIMGLGTAVLREGKQIAALQYPGVAKSRVWIASHLEAPLPFLMATVIEVLLVAATDTTDDQQMIRN